MNNPILQSESFDRAAYSLVAAMQRFPEGDFTEAVDKFARSVDKLGNILGMHAENDQRKVVGASMAYVDRDFFNA